MTGRLVRTHPARRGERAFLRGACLYSIFAIFAAAMMGGCAAPQASDPTLGVAAGSVPGLSESGYVPSVVATCPIPAGWQAQPLKANSQRTHQIWVSPSGMTAYGVVHFRLPWPVGPDWALQGFISAMRQTEGDAQLLEQHSDDRGIAFVADGGRYHMRAQLIVQGWEGWAIYSATLRAKPTVPAELKLAELAVQHTQIRDVAPPIPQARAGEQ